MEQNPCGLIRPAVDHGFDRNPGMPLDLAFALGPTINKSCIARRALTMTKRRSVKKINQLAWLVRAIQCVDLTTLAGDDTESNVHRLCLKARAPIRRDLLVKMGLDDPEKESELWQSPIHTGAVCVYPARVADAVRALQGSGIHVAAVATGFPSGQINLEQKLDEIRGAVRDGAKEIDIVISRNYALTGQWEKLYDEVRAFREACGEAHMKTILATGELATLQNVYRASMICMMAGADFIKTSTGKEKVNATLEVGLVMVRAIRAYFQRTGYRVGYKPAGGISTAKASCDWLSLMKEELGDEWCRPNLFRIGASSVVGDIERQLHHGVYGEYAGLHYIPLT